MAETKKTAKKRTVKADPEGQAHIQASFNNLIITFTNRTGETISWSSAGKVGFKRIEKKIHHMQRRLHPMRLLKRPTMRACVRWRFL